MNYGSEKTDTSIRSVMLYARTQWGVPTSDAWCVRLFFQAEDGIRDLTVTGVQTCALPISVSLDNALIAEATFSARRHGTITVHHGAVPEYRGGPPVFWELFDGRETVGFTVHRIDAGIDAGPVLAAGEVRIAKRGALTETLAATLPALHDASLDALESVLVSGRFEGAAQQTGGRARTTP